MGTSTENVVGTCIAAAAADGAIAAPAAAPPPAPSAPSRTPALPIPIGHRNVRDIRRGFPAVLSNLFVRVQRGVGGRNRGERMGNNKWVTLIDTTEAQPTTRWGGFYRKFI